MKALMRSRNALAVVLTVLMIVMLSGCGGVAETESKGDTGTQVQESTGSQDTSTQPEISTEPVTFTILIGPQDLIKAPGVQDTAVAKEITRLTGVTLDFILADQEKFKILSAGGDLPDLLELESADVAQSLINSGVVLALDDLLDKYGENIKKIIPTALKWSKEIIGGGKTYYLPVSTNVADNSNPGGNGFVGFFSRWDIYKAIGAPEINNEDEYLDVLKKMVDYQPKTKDGKKVYALSAWNDWALWPFSISYPFHYGYTNLPDVYQMLDRQSGAIENLYLDGEGIFWKGLKFWNKAYQKGILDPEAFTMKSDQYSKKIANGEVLTSAASWFQPDKAICGETAINVMFPGAFPILPSVYAEDSLLGWQLASARAISSNCKNPERAMQLLNFFESMDGSRLLINGVKGEDWDVLDGKPQLIGEKLKKFQEGGDAHTQYNLDRMIGSLAVKYRSGSWPGEDGFPLDLTGTIDFKIQNATAADKDFAKHYDPNLAYAGQVYDKFVKSGKANSLTTYPLASLLLGVPTDVTKQTMAKADQYYQANIARAIMAKTDADFDAAKKKMIDDVKAMGIEKAQQEIMGLLEKAQEVVGKFK